MHPNGRPWDDRPRLDVNIHALKQNYNTLKAQVGASQIAPVVKADGYGMGALQVSRALKKAGAQTFFVANFHEAKALRHADQDSHIACLAGVADDRATGDYLKERIIPVLNSLAQLKRWQNANQPAFIHLDTGMNRLGMPPNEQQTLLAEPNLLATIPALIYLSHLACADDHNHPLTTKQKAAFAMLRAKLPKGRASLCNSSGIFRGEDGHLDMVRPGAALYGINPTPETDNPMTPVVGLSARVLQTRMIAPPDSVGYSATFTTKQPTKIATLAAGYADGLHRRLGDKLIVEIEGHLCSSVGVISMDLTTIDVSDVPFDPTGHWVRIIGPHQDVDALARHADTIGYEVLTSLAPRVIRSYNR
ncbi:MAG: alanine racemase [Pseudomonadota bacterium]